MLKEMLNNQALSAHALFFDDVHRDLVSLWMPKGGLPGNTQYTAPSLSMKTASDFSFAPNAESVRWQASWRISEGPYRYDKG